MDTMFRVIKGIFITLLLTFSILMGYSYIPVEKFQHHALNRTAYVIVIIVSVLSIPLFHMLEKRAHKMPRPKKKDRWED